MSVQRNANGVIMNPAELAVDDVVGDRVLCPACGNKVFAVWPLGWDAHSGGHQCSVVGASARERKAAFKEQFRHLFR